MPSCHAIACVDHRSARILPFDLDPARGLRLLDVRHFTRQRGDGFRSEDDLFGEVCAVLDDLGDILLAGDRASLADFRRFVEKHHRGLAPSIAAYEVVEHPTDRQLATMARKRFAVVDIARGGAMA
jgi:hypothetical protein